MRAIDADIAKANCKLPTIYDLNDTPLYLDEQPAICCENCKSWYSIEKLRNGLKIGCCDSLYNFFNGDDIATTMKSYSDDFCSYFISIKKESAD